MRHDKDCDRLNSAHPCNCGLTGDAGPSRIISPEDAARLTASEGAAYAYPGEDQQALRTAFCDGAVYAITGKLPR